jgi:hypothetical protein
LRQRAWSAAPLTLADGFYQMGNETGKIPRGNQEVEVSA